MNYNWPGMNELILLKLDQRKLKAIERIYNMYHQLKKPWDIEYGRWLTTLPLEVILEREKLIRDEFDRIYIDELDNEQDWRKR